MSGSNLLEVSGPFLAVPVLRESFRKALRSDAGSPASGCDEHTKNGATLVDMDDQIARTSHGMDR